MGAIYLVVLNLPQSLRYCRENIILAGAIPGPQEPSLEMNSFLEPLKDLNKLWKGIQIETKEGKQQTLQLLFAIPPIFQHAGKLVGLGWLLNHINLVKM